MFISKEIKIGSTQTLNRNLSAMKGTVTKGSKVEVIGVDATRGYSIKDLDSGEELSECGWDIFTKSTPASFYERD